MNKYIIISFFFILLHSKSWCQCTPAIPANAIVADSTYLLNGGFDPVWVCKGDTLFTGGGFHNIYLEAGAVLDVSGGIDSIFVKNGATVLMTGGIHHVYYENINDLQLNGGIPTLDSCINLVFDYALAPVNGCFIEPVAALQASDSVICKNSCINFTDLSNNATGWQWYFPGATPATDSVKNPQQICYNSAGSFDVTLIVTNGSGSDTLTLPGLITVDPLPAVTGLQNGNVFAVTPGFAGYQWFMDTVLLAGANTDTLTVIQNGNYQVIVSDSNGCDTTLTFIYGIAGLNDPDAAAFSMQLIPNPATTFFTIRLIQNRLFSTDQEATIIMTDVCNKIIFESKFLLDTQTEIPLQNAVPGIYFVRVITGNINLMKKLVISGR